MRPNHIVTVSNSSRGQNAPGANCPCCCCCTCLHTRFLRTTPGILKIVQVVLGGMCQSLLVQYGLGYSGVIGSSYSTFLTTASACLLTTSVLLFCYLISERSFGLVRNSNFEVIFNVVACILYLAASSFLSFSVNVFLWPLYIITPFFQVYPAMTACYIMGLVVGIVHGVDGYLAYKQLKSLC